MNVLIPRKVVLESSLKLFSFDRGASDGSVVQVEFEVPEGVTALELKRLLLEEKEVQDLLVLTMERAKGSVTDSAWVARKSRLKAAYDTILKRASQNAETTE